ncbi:MAG TPA: LamG domain-containing protein, partial [Verrucomicrobiae bacterium]|nr:LamG domain-containing protein [Verrucomicrobiae bacterium]
MRNSLLRYPVSFLAMAVLVSANSLWAQSFYFKAVTNLSPVAYWPLQETNTPAAADVETNLGTLGSLANANYADLQGTSPVNRGFTGALAGDTDPAENFTGLANCYLATPAILTNLAQGPFTIEFWAWPTNTTFGMPIGKAGYEAQNGGGSPGAGGGSPIGGWTVDWHRSTAVWDMQIFHGGTGTAGATYIYGTAGASSTTGWQHVVFTYDGTNVTFYWNGQSNAVLAATYLPDTWSPLTIGAGRLADNATGDPGGHRFGGAIDEVALYSNALSANDVLAHYEAATNTAPAASYETLVLNDKPMVYYRMDALSYSVPASNTFPAVNNYGSASLSGFYPPNTLPGVVAGPDYSGIGSNGVASPINGLNAAIDGGYAASLNPPTGQPITATIWARGYPSDTRNQELMSHTDKSWHMFVDQSGKVHWNAGAGGEITSVKVFNDGKWHFLAGVYTGTQNLLFIDGALDSSSSATGSISGSTNDVYLGGASDYTSGTTERFFSGSMCQAAFFTNALSSSEIGQLYASGLSAGSAPEITLPPVVYAISNSVYTYTNLSISGTEPLSIQWYEGGALIPGATNSGYSFVARSNTTFSVVASNAYGVVTNGPSVVYIVTPPSDTFSQALLGLEPVAYWPMQETNAPALPDIETNFGSMGAVGNAYYADMASP